MPRGGSELGEMDAESPRRAHGGDELYRLVRHLPISAWGDTSRPGKYTQARLGRTPPERPASLGPGVARCVFASSSAFDASADRAVNVGLRAICVTVAVMSWRQRLTGRRW